MQHRIHSYIHRLLHDIPRIMIFFIEQLIFNHMLSIGSFGRRAKRRFVQVLNYRGTYISPHVNSC